MKSPSLLMLALAPLLAQTKSSAPQQDDPFLIKTSITVTATRTEEEGEASPVSAGLVTRQEIELRATRTIDQSISLLPGVYVQRGKGDAETTTKVNLRGFNGSGKSLVLLDGQPINDAYTGEVSWSTLPIDEVDRVEVVRGPFSSLYGGNALGGVIQILTRPVTRREVELRGQYGSAASTDWSARYSDRFWNRLGATLSYRRLGFGGYPSRFAQVSPVTTGTGGIPVTGIVPTLTSQGAATYRIGENGLNWFTQQSWRARAEYTPSAGTTFTAQYIHQESAYGYDAYSTYLRDTAGNPIDQGTILFNDQGISRRFNITPASFLQGPGQGRSHYASFTAQHKFNTRNYSRFDGGFFDQPEDNFRTPAATALAAQGTGNIAIRTGRSWHANAQHNWTPNSRHAFTFGTETRQDNSFNKEYTLSTWTLPDSQTAQTYLGGGRSLMQGIYGQDQFRWGERLTIVAGGRYDYWQTYDGLSTAFPSTGPATPYIDRSTNAFTGKVAASYTLPGEWVVRGSAGNAYRNPNVYELYRITRIATLLYFPSQSLQSERVRSWEAGVRRRFANRLDLDAAYYENHITDLIYRKTDLAADPTGRTRVFANAGQGRTRGFEFDARQRLASWLELRGNYTYTNALITNNAAAPQSEGKRVPQVPAHMASGSLFAAWQRWAGSTTARYAGGVFSTDTNADTTRGVQGAYDPFFTLEASASYQVNRNLQLYAQVENLLDRRYHLFYVNPGRLIYAGVRLKFY